MPGTTTLRLRRPIALAQVWISHPTVRPQRAETQGEDDHHDAVDIGRGREAEQGRGKSRRDGRDAEGEVALEVERREQAGPLLGTGQRQQRSERARKRRAEAAAGQ